MRRRLVQGLVAAGALVFLSPRPGLAQWFSWYEFGTEGSYVHSGLQRFRGFRLLAWAWGLLALWNLDALVGHWAEWTLYNPVISGEGFGRRILMYNVKTWLFYIGKIDHFVLLVPAFYLFYRGLKVLEHQTGADRS
jgi:hypothetical protein